MLTTVLFDMGGTLEDIRNNEQTRAQVMARLAQELQGRAPAPGGRKEED